MSMLEKYSLSSMLRAPEDGAGGGGAGAGAGAGSGAGGSGAGGGAGNGSGAGGQQNNGAGAGAGGNNAGGGANNGAGGGATPPWYAERGYDADTVKWVEERKFDSEAQMAKAGRDSAIFARDRNVLPKPDPKNLKGWSGWSELGYEPDAAKYQLTAPERKDGQNAIDKGAFDALQKSAHANMIPPAMASAVFADLQGYIDAQHTEFQTAQAAAATQLNDALKAKWGPNDAANRALAEKAFRYFMPNQATAKDVETAMGAAGLVEMMHTIGAAMGEDSLVTNKSGNGGFGAQSLAQVQSELDKLQNSDEFKEISKKGARDPRYREMMERRQAIINKKSQLQTAA